jgi:hypothetical protein
MAQFEGTFIVTKSIMFIEPAISLINTRWVLIPAF